MRAAPLGLAALAALLGCGGGAGRTAGTAGAAGPTGGAEPPAGRAGPAAGQAARSGGLTAKLVVTPGVVRRGRPVRIEVTANTPHAQGALGYLVRYGDGTTGGSGAVPQFCLAGPGRAARRAWSATHRYGALGRHVVLVSVYVNCTHDRVLVTAPVVVR